MKRVDLNVDVGEGFPYDAQLFKFATSANVCLGVHAGSWDLTRATADAARNAGLCIGAHPGFPDREGMGRRNPEPAQAGVWRASVVDQIARARSELGVRYVKPHGALYHLIAQGEAAWLHAVREASGELPLMLLAKHMQATRSTRHLREGFADRAYDASGQLVPRSEPGAVLIDPIGVVAQALRLAPAVDSICLHGDTPGCVKLARAIREALESAGWEVCS